MRLRNSCPYCKGDIYGSPRKGYYCPRCNVLHTRRELALRHIRHELREIIDEHFSAYSTEEVTDDLEEIRRAMSEIAELLRNPHAFDVAPQKERTKERTLREDLVERPLARRLPVKKTSVRPVKRSESKRSESTGNRSKRITRKKERPKSGKWREVHKTTKRKTAERKTAERKTAERKMTKRTTAKSPARTQRRQK